LKGKEKVEGKYCLVFRAYNLRRAMSILGINLLLALPKAVLFDIFVLQRREKRPSRNLRFENFSVVWRSGVVQGMRCAA